MKNLIVSRKNKKSEEEIKSKNREIESLKKNQNVRSARSDNAEKKSIRRDIPIQETAEGSDRKRCECCENYVQTTKEGD